MTPMRVASVLAAGELHPSPFVGPIDHTAAIRIDISGLTNKEVDAYGFLKPGVLFRKNGTLAGAEAGEKEVYVNGGGAGDITVTGIAEGDQLLEVTYFPISTGTVTGVSDLTSEFTIKVGGGAINNTGGTATTGGRLRVKFISAAGAATDYIFGAVVEATQIFTNNTGLGAVTDDKDVAVAVKCVLNRAILEDSLGRALTANELAALIAPGCQIVLV